MDDSYFKITLQEILSEGETSPFDIYMRLGSAKFVKVVNEGEDDILDILQTYSDRGVDFFFIQKAAYESFKERVEEHLKENLNSIEPDNSFSDNFDAMSQSFSSIRALVGNLGLGESTLKLTETLVDNLVHQADKETDLETLFEILDQKGDYINKQAFLTGFVVNMIFKQMSWTTEDLERKALMAALFQNLALETEAQARITHLDDPGYGDLDDFSKELVEKHPMLSADLVKSPSFSGDEIYNMIRNHHELPISGSFPGRLQSGNVAITDACFILASHFATLTLNHGQEKKAEVIDLLKDHLQVGNFKRALGILLTGINAS